MGMMHRTIPILATLVTVLSAQTTPPEINWNSFDRKLEILRAAVAARDLEKANHAASDLWQFSVEERSRTGPTSADYLREAEMRVAGQPRSRALSLPWMAKLAFDAGDLVKAGLYAREALDSPSYPFGSGDSIHDGNMVLGLIAAKNGDVPAAKGYLLAAAKTPGTSITRRFGPNMKLAKELAGRGEYPTVIEYLETLRKIMTDNQKYVDDWIAMLKGGRPPDFTRNLGN